MKTRGKIRSTPRPNIHYFKLQATKSATAAVAISLLAQSFAGTVSAATVLSVQSGSVLVDAGSGFAAVTGELSISPGSRILLKADAKASLKDDISKCNLPLRAELVLTVPAAVPCTATISTSAMHAGAPPPVEPVVEPAVQPSVESVVEPPTDATPPSSGPSPLLIGVGVAGVVGLAVAVSSKGGSGSEKKPASP